MVKLIRLTTDNSNAHFKAQFDSNITLDENSKIALKNLTFESDFFEYESTTTTARVAFVGDGAVANDFIDQFVEPANYGKPDFDLLLREVSQAFNRCISLQDGKSNNRAHKEIYGQFRLKLNNNNKVRLEFRQSQAQNPSSLAYQEPYLTGRHAYLKKDPFPDPLGQAQAWSQPAAPFNKFDLTNPQLLSLQAAADKTPDERYWFIPRFGLGLSKAAGAFYCRIRSSVIDGADPTHNGFSIGISFGNPRMPDDTDIPAEGIAPTERNIEVTFQDKNTNYFFRKTHKGVASVSTDSTFAPVDVDSANIDQHDIIMFKIDNNPNNVKAISAHIYDHNGGAGRERLIFSLPLTDEELSGTFTPYIYMRGNQNNIVLDMVRYTPDPFYEIDGTNIVIDSAGGQGCDDVVGLRLDNGAATFDNSGQITEPISQAIRTAVAIHYAGVGANHLLTIPITQPSLSINGPLAEVLGINKRDDHTEFLPSRNEYQSLPFGKLRYTTNINFDNIEINSYGFTIDALFESTLLLKDSYIVETLSLPLVSYNSSLSKVNNQSDRNRQTRGGRRNILATIPKTSENALVQYEPNELIYIDIDNKVKLNLRNLELRILDADLEPIRIIGEADMTLLIDN